MLLFLSFQHNRKNLKETSKRQSRKHGHDCTSPSQQHMVSTVPASVQSSSVSASSKHKQKVVSTMGQDDKTPPGKEHEIALGDLCYSCYNVEKFQPGLPATLQNLDGDVIPMLDMVMSSKTGGHSARKRRQIHMT